MLQVALLVVCLAGGAADYSPHLVLPTATAGLLAASAHRILVRVSEEPRAFEAACLAFLFFSLNAAAIVSLAYLIGLALRRALG